MKTFGILSLLFTLLLCGSCYRKLYNKLESKGYNPYVDTIIVKEYEFLIKHKGYTHIFQECETVRKLDAKLSIAGFENSDYIPKGILLDTIKFSISDTSIKKINSGIFNFAFLSGAAHYKFLNEKIDSVRIFYNRRMINRILERQELRSLVMFSFCIKVSKDGIEYTLPSKVYYFR